MEIRPFRGYRYSAARVSDMSSVVAPPYDQISPETQSLLYDTSPWNMVRITLGREGYAAARTTLDRWRASGITDPATIARVEALMADRRVIIADGHHRYETAVAYSRRHPGAPYKMMAFFALDAPGMTIFPNHRLVHDVEAFSLDRLLGRAAQ